MRQANIPANKAHQRWMLKRILDLQAPGEKEVRKTELHPDDYQMAVEILKEREIIERILPYEEFFQPVCSFNEWQEY